jgi:hypothetical protein
VRGICCHGPLQDLTDTPYDLTVPSCWKVSAPSRPPAFVQEETFGFTSLDAGLQSDIRNVVHGRCRAILLDIWKALRVNRLPPPIEHLLKECEDLLKQEELSNIPMQIPERTSRLKTLIEDEFQNRKAPTSFHGLRVAGYWNLTYSGAALTGFYLIVGVDLSVYRQGNTKPFMSVHTRQEQLIQEVKADSDLLKEIVDGWKSFVET